MKVYVVTKKKYLPGHAEPYDEYLYGVFKSKTRPNYLQKSVAGLWELDFEVREIELEE
jgi:hypothetical protein